MEFVIVFCLYYLLSCMAICDLLRGRNLDEVVDKMAELWEILFRVRDDIKVCPHFVRQ